MKLKERKIGAWYQAEGCVAGERIRFALGTQNGENAHRTVSEVERAFLEGSVSLLWPKLHVVLPTKTFNRLARIAGYSEPVAPVEHTWPELSRLFREDAQRRIALGRFRASTLQRYEFEIREFGIFLAEHGVLNLARIDRPLVEQFKAWRLDRIRARSKSGAAKSLSLCAAIVHRVFSFAVENEFVAKNPVRLEGRPGENPEAGAQPFKPEEIRKLRESAGPDMLTFLLLRWTGFRGSDAVALTWAEVDWDAREIVRVTQKRGKRVILPIHLELFFALEVERGRRKPELSERVLLNPQTAKPFTRNRLYERMVALGRRAGVVNAHPHRFRDSLAVEMLVRGASPYDVAKTLGDTIQTVEGHYAPFVPELRERVRRILESGPEAEELGRIWAESEPKKEQVQ